MADINVEESVELNEDDQVFGKSVSHSNDNKVEQSVNFKSNEDSQLDNSISSRNAAPNESSEPEIPSGVSELNDGECGSSKVTVSLADDSKPGTSKDNDEWLDILGSGHLKKKVLVEGKEDSRPQRGDTVILDILGRLENGDVFEQLENVEVTIGDFDVVKGIDYALTLMNDGEKAEIFIKPRFGYGSLGNPPSVPKDVDLTYIVTIKKVVELKDISEYTLEERLQMGQKKKDRGNWWYQRKDYSTALQCYRRALVYFEQDVKQSNSQLDQEIIKTYNNLSVAYFNLETYDQALTNVDKVLLKQPDNIKAIYRKVKILKSQGEIEDAIALARKGLKLKPDSPALQDELNLLVELKKKNTQAQKEIYQKMFQTINKKEDKKSLMNYSWKILGVLTLAVGIIGAAAIKYKY